MPVVLKLAITAFSPILLMFLMNSGCQGQITERSPTKEATVPKPAPLPACEWCGTEEAPDELSWDIEIADPATPAYLGQRISIEGVVHYADSAPAAGIILYLYHTNAEGLYKKRGDETGNGQRHGHLRGWIKTNANGQYRFQTIRPAPYPTHNEAAHVHITVKVPDREEYWLDSFVFDDDPLLTPEVRAAKENRGGSGVVRLRETSGRIWAGRRDIFLLP